MKLGDRVYWSGQLYVVREFHWDTVDGDTVVISQDENCSVIRVPWDKVRPYKPFLTGGWYAERIPEPEGPVVD